MNPFHRGRRATHWDEDQSLACSGRELKERTSQRFRGLAVAVHSCIAGKGIAQPTFGARLRFDPDKLHLAALDRGQIAGAGQPGKGAGYSRWHHVRHGLQRHGLGRTGSSGSIENYGGLPQHDEFRPCVAWRLKPATSARVSRHHKSSTRLPDRVRIRIEACGRPSAQANRLVVSPASAVHRPFFDAGSSSIRAFACQEACVCAFITVCPAIR